MKGNLGTYNVQVLCLSILLAESATVRMTVEDMVACSLTP